jgi:hypothetical protein
VNKSDTHQDSRRAFLKRAGASVAATPLLGQLRNPLHAATPDPGSPLFNNGFNGAKFANYSKWAPCTWYPESEADANLDFEFYDYGNTPMNRKELGNDYHGASGATLTLRDQLKTALGKFAPASGLIQNQLLAPLPSSLQPVQLAARQRYLNFLYPFGCS